MKKLQPLLMAAMLAAALPALAADDFVLAAATASLGPLSYQLEDLDPTDGITPAITFHTPVLSLVVEDGARPVERRVVAANPFEPGAGTVALAGPSDHVLATFPGAPGGATASNVFYLSELPQGEPSVFEGNSILTSRRAAYAVTGNGEAPDDLGQLVDQALRWTLTPNTRVTFQAQASAAVSSQLRELEDSGLFRGPGAPYNTVIARHTVSAALVLIPFSEWMAPDNAGQGLETAEGILQDGYFDLGLPMSSAGLLTVTAANGQAQSLEGSLLLQVRARSEVMTAVPEPETWALLLAGLGTVMGAGRARRRRALPAAEAA